MKRIQIVTALISGMGCQQTEDVIKRAYDTADFIIKHDDPEKAKTVEERIARIKGLQEKVASQANAIANADKRVQQLELQLKDASRPVTDPEAAKKVATAEADRDEALARVTDISDNYATLDLESERLKKEVAELSEKLATEGDPDGSPDAKPAATSKAGGE